MKDVKQKQSFFSSVREIVTLLLIVFLIRTFGFGLYQVPTGSMETTMLVGERFFADKFSYLFTKPKRGDIIACNEPIYQFSENKWARLWEEYVWGPSNWTKRVIGVPGDIIKGEIKDGKPLVYRNGELLNEPYVNKYPLIKVYMQDPVKALEKAQQDALALVLERRIDPARVAEYVGLVMANSFSTFRSYDPAKPYNDQPFYNLNPEWVVKGPDGMPILKMPGTAHKGHQRVTRNGNSYWSDSDDFYVELGADEYWLMGDNRLGSRDSRDWGPLKEKMIHGKIIFRIWSIDSDYAWWIFDLILHPVDFFKRVRWSRCLQWVS